MVKGRPRNTIMSWEHGGIIVHVPRRKQSQVVPYHSFLPYIPMQKICDYGSLGKIGGAGWGGQVIIGCWETLKVEDAT
jgi:hypothetical protein